MIAPDTIKNTLDRRAWESGHADAMAFDRIPDPGRATPNCVKANYWLGWNQGRADKIK